ncbi:hypothetical protein JCM1841_005832 [Sporobolomyces salmonicolor]
MASSETQDTMRSALYYGKGDIRIEKVPLPQIKAGMVRVKVAWCGICGTDLHEYEAGPILCPTTEKPHPITGCGSPVCLGHEFSGIVDAVGSGLESDWNVGDRVVIESVISCHSCYACSIGCGNACHSLGFVGLSTSPSVGGGLSEYFLSLPEYLHKLPDSVSLKAGAMCEPLAVAMHAVKRSGFRKGMSALVCGAGPIGCFIIKVLVAQGASLIITSEPSSTRRAVASKAGSHHVLDPLSTDVARTVKELAGAVENGVDVAFEAAAVGSAFTAALNSVKTRGTVLNVSVWSKPAQIDMNQLVFGEKAILGASCYRDDHPATIGALADKRIDLEGFVTATIKLDDLVAKGFRELIHNNEQHVKILVSPSGQLDQPF